MIGPKKDENRVKRKNLTTEEHESYGFLNDEFSGVKDQVSDEVRSVRWRTNNGRRPHSLQISVICVDRW